jgi:hypothetical protein
VRWHCEAELLEPWWFEAASFLCRFDSLQIIQHLQFLRSAYVKNGVQLFFCNHRFKFVWAFVFDNLFNDSYVNLSYMVLIHVESKCRSRTCRNRSRVVIRLLPKVLNPSNGAILVLIHAESKYRSRTCRSRSRIAIRLRPKVPNPTKWCFSFHIFDFATKVSKD